MRATLPGRNRIDLAYIHAFKAAVDGSGGGAIFHLEEDSVAISLSHGFR